MTVEIKLGDITREKVDAIVNAANESLLGGGGVDGAIHRAAGRGLVQECRVIQQKKDGDGFYQRCAPGESVVTGGHNLPSRLVIHTVGPRCVEGKAGPEQEETLRRCWRNSLEKAKEMNLKSIAFPSIATGGFLFPLRKAAVIAVDEINSHISRGTSLENIKIVCFSPEDEKCYRAAYKGEEEPEPSEEKVIKFDPYCLFPKGARPGS
jgi:O-acetyl-ADP-ribose deacetylase (regulator of RNase III)